ncbi:MAG: Smr/MutS family protein, partial [candidate division NC10 bacterium]|nr:Smr/MutS family protein [candidate division NC10 bacterium]
VLRSEEARAGLRVWVRHLGQRGYLLSSPSPEGLVEVQLPMGKARIPIKSLSPMKEESRARSSFTSVLWEGREEVSAELNLLGSTTEEAAARTVKYLDDAFLAGLRRVRIIHGKGRGALRKAVTKVLRDHPLVEEFGLADFDEGGAGATIVKLIARSSGSN